MMFLIMLGSPKVASDVSGLNLYQPPDYQVKRLTTRPLSLSQLVGNPGRKELITSATKQYFD